MREFFQTQGTLEASEVAIQDRWPRIMTDGPRYPVEARTLMEPPEAF